MDYSNGNEAFQGQEGDYYLEDSSLDIAECMWDGATHDEDFSYMDEDSTPIKACGGAPFHFGNNGEMSRKYGGCRVNSSQVKRRRMLQFSNEDLDLPSQNDESTFLKSKERLDAVDEALLEASQLEARFEEDTSSSGLVCPDQSEGWLADCFNYSEMNDSSTDMNTFGMDDVLIDVTEFSDPLPTVVVDKVQQRTVRTSRNVIFKGRKSYMQTPTKLASSVAYPFTFIKPSGVNGDMTLKEINQRIQGPPPLKPKEEDPATYGTSAFSGKPIVNKTRIRTEGGKGSITIMKTKG